MAYLIVGDPWPSCLGVQCIWLELWSLEGPGGLGGDRLRGDLPCIGARVVGAVFGVPGHGFDGIE